MFQGISMDHYVIQEFDVIIIYTGWWFQPTPLKNMSSSIRMMNFPTEWKNKIHVPNHQAAFDDEKLHAFRSQKSETILGDMGKNNWDFSGRPAL